MAPITEIADAILITISLIGIGNRHTVVRVIE
jgi:hypothetical protein